MSMQDVKTHLSHYDSLSSERLRSHLADFLSEVAPLARDISVRPCRHPDNPPLSLPCLPRVMSTVADYRAVMVAVDVPLNAITLSTGILRARADNDLPGVCMSCACPCRDGRPHNWRVIPRGRASGG